MVFLGWVGFGSFGAITLSLKRYYLDSAAMQLGVLFPVFFSFVF
jgi:hypothetical protein